MPDQRAELVVTATANASAEEVWAALVDWDRQGDWMLGTRVKGTARNGRGVGGGIEAWTGVGPLKSLGPLGSRVSLGFLDTMVITEWEPPRRCLVDHTGRVVRGAGAFEVEPLSAHRSRILWAEYLDLPWGPVGRIGWALARPAVRWGVVRSLQRLARHVETAYLPR